jgi:nucleoside-diphosphate-sugar epimerase
LTPDFFTFAPSYLKEMDLLNILVTGGSGFLGSAVVRELIGTNPVVGSSSITVFDIRKPAAYTDPRVGYRAGDICNFSEIMDACRDIDLVIHTAAIVDWGTHPEEEVYAVNVTGTENVIRACRQQKVKYLVFTSSLDAIYTGRPMIDIDESIPFPKSHPNMYCRSKELAERAVSAANSESLHTVMIRPSDVYGEGDPYHIGSLVNMARGGFYVRLGNGKTKSQHTYVGNVAHAHLLAARAILNGSVKVAGNAYFITDGPGSNFFHFFDRIVEGIGYTIRPKNFWIPRGVAYVLGAVSEFAAILARPVKRYNPKFSRFAVVYTCTDFTFTSDKAMADFGFEPKYTDVEALARTIAYFKKDCRE